jgi:hypothetical protein
MAPYKTETKDRFVAIRVTTEQHKKLKELSAVEDVKMSDILRAQLKDFLRSL